MIQREMKIRVGCFLISLIFCIGVQAADTFGGEALRGIKPFKVLVAMGTCPTDLIFKVDVALNRDIEVKLRVARISIDPKASLPMLLLNVECLRVSIGDRQLGYAVHMELTLAQYLLNEDTKQHVLAMTWRTLDGQICPMDSCPDAIRSSAKNMTDEFINDFLKANETK